MKKEIRFITDLSSEEALSLLMTSEQYHSFELPEYFDFDKVLEFVRTHVDKAPFNGCIASYPSEAHGINVDILLNKDGKYAVRPLCLTNPFLYYFLAREVCLNNWETIKEHFKKCAVPSIKPCAMPVIPEKVESFHKSTTILNWWNSMEQQSIELSLQYRYMFVSDITNCYGSINPQAIDWALCRTNTSLNTEKNHELAQNIILYLRELQEGRNIGIPQGSTLFDLIGETVLSYADLLLYEALKRKGINAGYYILRYRDDYRVFCNDRDLLESISYILQHVLESLNFRMNSSKTHITDSIITDSIKSDKLFYIFNTPIFNKKGCDFDGLQKHLLYILMFGRKFPNSGQLRTMLSDFDKRIIEKLKPHEVTSLSTDKNEEEVFKTKTVPGKIVENVHAMSAIATQIAIENVSVSHYALRVISRMVHSLQDECLHNEIINQVCTKLIHQPNSSYTQIWLQNMTYQSDVENRNPNRYDTILCKMVSGEKHELWNLSWLKSELTKDFPNDSIVNKDSLAKITPVITFRETRAYMEANGNYGDMGNFNY